MIWSYFCCLPLGSGYMGINGSVAFAEESADSAAGGETAGEESNGGAEENNGGNNSDTETDNNEGNNEGNGENKPNDNQNQPTQPSTQPSTADKIPDTNLTVSVKKDGTETFSKTYSYAQTVNMTKTTAVYTSLDEDGVPLQISAQGIMLTELMAKVGVNTDKLKNVWIYTRDEGSRSFTANFLFGVNRILRCRCNVGGGKGTYHTCI